VYKLIGEDRPEISILSDAFLDQVAGSGEYTKLNPNRLGRTRAKS
jgi:hypothetical protein